MARGLAKAMGFDLMLNFNNPYLATGIGEFWNRWHISLSTWFRDYVYIPLGGNRKGVSSTYRNLFLTFLISGIWHGANWTFMIWGALHGLGVLVTRELERSAAYRERVPKLAKQIGVFLFVTFTWIFFRASSLPEAMLIVRRIFTAEWLDPQIPAMMVILVGLAVSMVVYLSLCASSGGAFIYFQF
jgi:D-alanyl-lipoteichoic acid acyltransferase DltB (MBOAT superfamily)